MRRSKCVCSLCDDNNLRDEKKVENLSNQNRYTQKYHFIPPLPSSLFLFFFFYLCLLPWLEGRLFRSGGRAHNIIHQPLPQIPNHAAANLPAVLTLLLLVRKFEFDAVHAHPLDFCQSGRENQLGVRCHDDNLRLQQRCVGRFWLEDGSRRERGIWQERDADVGIRVVEALFGSKRSGQD